MAIRSAADVNAMRVAYLGTDFSIRRLQENFQEASFTRAELLQFLNTLSTSRVKVSLALLPNTNQITIVMLGVNTAGNLKTDTDGLFADIPCPPKCRTQPAKSNILISV